MIKNDYLWEKYNAIWDKVSTDIKKKKNLTSSLFIIKKRFLKAIIKSHGEEVTDFYDKEIPKVGSNHTCLALISLDIFKSIF